MQPVVSCMGYQHLAWEALGGDGLHWRTTESPPGRSHRLEQANTLPITQVEINSANTFFLKTNGHEWG